VLSKRALCVPCHLDRPLGREESAFPLATTFHGSATLSFVISTEAQRSGEISVWMLRLGNVFLAEHADM
jgi:hypothetical protein